MWTLWRVQAVGVDHGSRTPKLRGGWLLRFSQCPDADLSGANLYYEVVGMSVSLFSSNLSGANLNGVDLVEADLSGATLTRADLTGADLSGADLTGADLTGAKMNQTLLSGANLSGADLRPAILCFTTLPDGTTDNSGCEVAESENFAD